MPAAGLIRENLKSFAAAVGGRQLGLKSSIRWRLRMTLTNVALWLVLIGLIALVPLGCYMTRGPKRDVVPGIKPH